MEDKIRANAELVIRQLGPISGLDFGYNAESVGWVDDFIERQRSRSDLDQTAIDGLVNTLGSFLGECIIRCFGGRWQQVDGQWGVVFNNQNAVYPFNKVHKQFMNGGIDSIKSFFASIPTLFEQHLEKTEQLSASAAIQLINRFEQQAENAYDRLYDEISSSGRAAAYNECKESISEAIRLARQLGLTAKITELGKKLDHYKNVFHHQMNF